MIKALVIGSGGREHALAWKLRKSASVSHVWCAPGSDGIGRDAKCVAASTTNIAELAELAAELKPDFTVVGPELPLVAGLADQFSRRGMRVIGPSQAAARLEGSKIFAKQFLERHGIPTAPTYGIYDSVGEAYAAMCAVDWPVVIKADGPCAGKGVLVTSSPDEATAFIERLMDKQEFGEAGTRILVEEALEGKELSFIVLTDGEHILPLAPSRDHKRAFDGDQGPNTGGMGAISADGMIPAALEDEILQKVVRPTLDGMAKDGSPYVGFLYCGLMLTSEGPKVLEFNCRMGDPECQAIVARMDFDLGEALQAAGESQLDRIKARWRPAASVCVVLASGGYPGHYETGKPISGLADAESLGDVVVFHAGTRVTPDGFATAGGRVLGVTATGADPGAAGAKAYAAASRIRFEGMHYRKDIGIVG
jgi:phosphoribosylamine--glycine ligase